MKYVPNLLSLSRIPLSIALFVFAVQHEWFLATVMFMVALVTDALDGYVARRYHLESSFGGDVLEPVCDLVLSAAAVAGLYFGGVVRLWVPIGLLVITALLQASHATPYTWLKRHTYYLHPLFFLGVVNFAGAIYLISSFESPSVDALTVIFYELLWILAAFLKQERLRTWFAGPPHAS